MNELAVYKSSAGSGKTFTLVNYYLQIVLQRPEDFKHILCITFTNKATTEMKERIITALVELSNDQNKILYDLLKQQLPQNLSIKAQAQRALKMIIHNYSLLSITTIDSFFQRIIKSISKEIKLAINAEIELDDTNILNFGVNKIFEQIATDPIIRNWLKTFTLEQLNNDHSHKIKESIAVIGKKMLHSTDFRKPNITLAEFNKIKLQIFQIKVSLIKTINANAKKIIDTATQLGYNEDNFANKERGPFGNTKKLTMANSIADASDILGRCAKYRQENAWVKKENYGTAFHQDYLQHLKPLITIHLDFLESKMGEIMSAQIVLKSLNSYALMNTMDEYMKMYRTSENKILLSDITKMLKEFISDNDTPFLYEKTGNQFKYLLLDEFQDTSIIQWENLKPLIINSIGEHHRSLIVGDAKQSIYRFRGGDISIITELIDQDLHRFNKIIKHRQLATNYRSFEEIVKFNNAYFEFYSANLNLPSAEKKILLKTYDSSVKQLHAPRNASKGYVEVHCNLKLNVCETITNIIKDQIGLGFKASDICILVRKNASASEITSHLVSTNTCKVYTQEGIPIMQSQKVSLLLNLLKSINNPADHLSKAAANTHFIQYKYSLEILDSSLFTKIDKKEIKGDQEILFPIDLNGNNSKELISEFLAPYILQIKSSSVYEILEQLVIKLQLNDEPDSFVQTFLDLTLEYSNTISSDLGSFIQYFDDDKLDKIYIESAEDEKAVKIMTAHKSKGLQFPIVINLVEPPKSQTKDIIMVQESASPYDELNTIPVNNLKENSHATFGSQIIKHNALEAINELNVKYVAFTRAEEKLFILDCSSSTNSETIKITQDFFSKIYDQQSIFDANTMTYKMGINHAATATSKKTKATSQPLKYFYSHDYSSKISIKLHAAEFYQHRKKTDMEAKEKGKLIHEILSKIEHSTDIDRAIDEAIIEGKLLPEYKQEIKENIASVIEHPEVAKFFSMKGEIKKEQAVLLPGNKLLRPDRVIIENDRATIIDFKTGAQKTNHQLQVDEYGRVLSEMGYDCKKYLIYTHPIAVVALN